MNHNPGVNRMKNIARNGFLSSLVAKAHAGQRPDITLKPKGVTCEELEKYLKANNCGWTKHAGGRYVIGSLRPARKAA